MKVYIAGPMTGLPDYNRLAFHDAADALHGLGHEPLNPAAIDLGGDAVWQDYMRATTRLLTQADAVCVLPGWEKSRGAYVEVLWARGCGIPVLDLATGRAV